MARDLEQGGEEDIKSDIEREMRDMVWEVGREGCGGWQRGDAARDLEHR